MMALREQIWKALRHTITCDDLSLLRRVLPDERVPSQAQIDAYLDELRDSAALRDVIDTPDSRRFHAGVSAGMTAQELLEWRLALDGRGRGRALLLYITARIARPAVIIETGCFSGWDSAVLLQALRLNGHGHLWSIDLPATEGRFSQVGENAGLPDGMRTGFLVPEIFRDRWTLIEADVRDALPGLLRDIGAVDMFLHDSDHAYTHMMWEFATVLPRMRPGGIIVSDDISWNTAFWDFSTAARRQFAIPRGNANVGALRVEAA